MQNERGSILIHVAISMIGLLAFGAVAIDYGVMWTARRQAQNAADAAALAGAISLQTYGSDWDRARGIAQAIGEANYVFGEAPSITLCQWLDHDGCRPECDRQSTCRAAARL